MKIICCTLALAVVGVADSSIIAGETPEVILRRVSDDIEYLASEKLEGRGVETKGIHLAADHIIDTYRQFGLKPGMPDGTYKQAFTIALGKSQIGDETGIVFTDPDGRRISLARNIFEPLQRGANGSAKGELAFVGYGITSDEDSYDDYAGLELDGKILVMIRREPRQGRDDGGFKGKETTQHSYIDTKLKLALDHKAAGVIFVNDPFTASSSAKDELSQPSGFGTSESGIPFVHVKQSVVDSMLGRSPLTVGDQTFTTLRQVTDYIDENLKPVSQIMTGHSAELTTKFNTSSVEAYNLIGILEGEGELADETIVVGAHYDHLGYGGYGSRAKDRTGEIHFGADDNATGTAAVMEIIRRVAGGPALKRRVVFICFSGEERGLLGSKHYVANPIIPLEKTVAMLNYDMIGTLRNNKIDVNGVGTAAVFRPIVEAAAEASPLEIKIVEHPFAGSDHLPFFQKQIPVMFCFTGITPRYHTPDDSFEMINVPGVVTVVDYTEMLLRGIDALPTAPEFRSVGRRSAPVKLPYFGVVPNLSSDADEAGIPLQSVRTGSPAEKAGLKASDVITRVDETEVDGHGDLVDFLKNAKPGQKIMVTVSRQEEVVTLPLTLGSPR